MNEVIITGFKGFIGSRLYERACHVGIGTLGIDAEYLQEDDWNSNLVNLLDSSNCRYVFHVGACANTLETNVQKMMIENYETTKVIADWCERNGRGLIYSSSAANYGTNYRYPSNLYGWSKYAAEDYVIKTGGIALRYFNVYGPGEADKGNMASFAFQAYNKRLRGEKVLLFPGFPRRDFVYIDDVINANFYAMNHFDELRGSFYEVSTSASNTFEDVLHLLNISFNYTKEEEIPKGYQRYTCGDQSKWMPGWKPQYNLEKGLQDYLRFLDSWESSE
jgi:ADP-L-glycero-D-manno-heptose 6-epimerase